jgi:hypothetical protein
MIETQVWKTQESCLQNPWVETKDGGRYDVMSVTV